MDDEPFAVREPAGAAVRVEQSAWIDLVFHGLAHLPVDPRDASGLHDAGYVAWAATRLRPEPRTLPGDAALLAGLYDRAADAPALQALAVLYDDVPDLGATAARPFAELPFADPARAELARRVAGALPEALVDLFRIALLGEVRAGYLEVRARELGPRYAAAAADFGAALRALAGRWPLLARAAFCLSHPLLAAGRAFHPPGRPAPLVIVGIEDAALGVPRGAPLVQAVHEVLVALVQEQLEPRRGAPSCRADRPGFAAHLGPELAALCLGAEVLGTSESAAAHAAWLARLYPDGVAAVLAEMAGAGLRPRRPPGGAAGLVQWLAAGDAVPADCAAAWARARALLAGGDAAR